MAPNSRATGVAKRDSSARSMLSKNRRTRQSARLAAMLVEERQGLLRRTEEIEHADMPEHVEEEDQVKKAEDGFTSGDVETGILESGIPQESGKGKGKARVVDEVVDEKEEKPFRFMDLPAELRLHIYRACLTRPYNVLLSKGEAPAQTYKPLASLGDRNLDTSTWTRAASDRAGQNGWSVLTPQEQRASAQHRHAAVRRVTRLSRIARVSQAINQDAIGDETVPPWTDTAAADDDHSIASSSSANSWDSSATPPATTDAWSTSARKRNYACPDDPLIITLLRTSKQVYKEARYILYSENIFTLNLDTAVSTFACLHQRSRRHIKTVEVEIPTYAEIIERFSEVVRLSLRYCSGLRKFVVHTPFTVPGADSVSNGTVYVNGFDILRWLPQTCEVVLKGTRNEEIEAVVRKHQMLAKAQDPVSFFLLPSYVLLIAYSD